MEQIGFAMAVSLKKQWLAGALALVVPVVALSPLPGWCADTAGMQGWHEIVPWGLGGAALALACLIPLLLRLRRRTTELRRELEANRRLGKELRTGREQYRELVEQANIIILRLQLDGTILFCNEYAQSFFGYPRDELIGRNLIGTIVPEIDSDGNDMRARIRVVLTTREHYYNENENIRKNGERVWVGWSNKPLCTAQGEVRELLCVGQDITERRRLEQLVMQQQKLEGIGLLAGGIAHDFNNMLTPIYGYAEMIAMRSEPDDTSTHYASLILEAADKSKDLIRQLLTFSRKQALSFQRHDLNEIITNFMNILRRTIRESIEIRTMLSEAPCPVRADWIQIEQVLINLAVNAQDATNGTGLITIETGSLILDDEYCQLHPGASPGEYAMLAFSDCGSGMDDETLSHIFEPFYTTKPSGSGTGLGLSTVYGIVKQHNGYIDVQSTVGHGSVFRIYLPLHTSEAVPTSCTAAPCPVAGIHAATVLLVEDNRMVMELVKELLEGHGHVVYAADTPEAAIAIARDKGRSINLLVSDVVMPQMNGPELRECLAEFIPGLKVLYMSGYANNVIVHGGALEEISFIAKPFTTEAFMKRMSQVLAGGRQ
ncbi:PAS domain S-box protein [Geobacter sp. FeAm09]|uniref:hybrid sensor histidine kinase/response regulator n=1 Tax=Geobacter sp. FeAm09 TaxID=2597769 RepID=UPI0011EBDD6A|nr:PAS domain S-box protein [Geobacter sp. FeAm09]QEM67109.1 PAS domain S-box protein [Geobacter sp. FeAm09]